MRNRTMLPRPPGVDAETYRAAQAEHEKREAERASNAEPTERRYAPVRAYHEEDPEPEEEKTTKNCGGKKETSDRAEQRYAAPVPYWKEEPGEEKAGKAENAKTRRAFVTAATGSFYE